jgi:hypothetical protein
MQNPISSLADQIWPRNRHSTQRPVVVIEQNQKDLRQLIELYLGLADIILVPNAYVGLTMINQFKSQHIEIMAIEGLFGCGTSLQDKDVVPSLVI